MTKFANFDDLKKGWLKDAEFVQAYRDLEVEYEIALELIKARKQSGLTQEEVALRMGTTQSVIARLESGKAVPSLKTLAKYAQATGKHLHLSLV
jgi:ribosome-binding protein aMBF1 (putative translation factor)